MSDKWFYAKGKQKHGPVSESELNGLAHSGQLAPTDMVWKEGMAEWKPATSIPGIFTPGIPGNTVSEDLGNAAKEVAHAGATVAKAGQKFISRIGTFADKVGNIAGEAVVFDQTLPTKPHEPAIFLRELYFGGRRHIGGSLDQMRTMGGKIMAAVFSFFYIGLMLHFPLSSRQFLPYSKAELVQITLRQKLRWEKLVPILIAWFVTVVVGLLMSFLWGFLVAMLITSGQPGVRYRKGHVIFGHPFSMDISGLYSFCQFGCLQKGGPAGKLQKVVHHCSLWFSKQDPTSGRGFRR